MRHHYSQLKALGLSPAHYKQSLATPKKISAPMRMGTLVNDHVYEVSSVGWIIYDGQRRGNAWKDFKESHTDVDIVTVAENERAKQIAAAVMSNPEARKLIEAGESQRYLEWESHGFECAGTPDTCGRVLGDLKVTKSADPDRFPWHANRMGWYGQIAWYHDGQIAATSEAPESDSIIAVEPDPPFVVTVFDLTEGAVDYGRRMYCTYLERLRVCLDNDDWPGYVRGIAVLEPPMGDVFTEDDESSEESGDA